MRYNYNKANYIAIDSKLEKIKSHLNRIEFKEKETYMFEYVCDIIKQHNRHPQTFYDNKQEQTIWMNFIWISLRLD